MFCTNCGESIPDGSKFCTSCGAPAPSESAPSLMTEPEVPATSNKGLKVAAVALSIVAVLTVVGVSAALTNGFGLIHQEETSRDAAADAASKSKKDAEEEREAEEEAEPEKEPEEEPVAEPEPDQEPEPEPSSISVDLADQEEFRELNVAVSNFTEQGFDKGQGDKAFSRDDVDYLDLVAFYYNHCLYNGLSAYGMEPVPEGDPMLEGTYFNYRVPVSRARSFFETRMGISPTDEQLSFDPNGPSPDPSWAYRAQVSGDWLYLGFSSGDAMPSMGVASVTSITDLGNNRYRVNYDVYVPGSAGGGHLMIDTIERDWYGLPANELAEAVGAAGVDRSGSAVFEVHEAEGARKFVLEEMDVSTPA